MPSLIKRLLDKVRQWFDDWVMRTWIWYHLNAYDVRRAVRA
ncbi:hypothetical protein [Mesorhizobium sp. LSHC414A00]|nr:hypothetical protein [Mesorhizobium sp. LSHC414A00]